jgi:hypothetical protein
VDQEANSRLQALIQSRKDLRTRGLRKESADIGKEIEREIRALSRAKKKARIEKILVQFKGLKFITGIRKNEKRQHIGSMRDAKGEVHTDRQQIANIFADFYEQLYAEMDALPGDDEELRTVRDVRPVLVEEVRDQLKKMARDKSADSKGMVVELLQYSADGML